MRLAIIGGRDFNGYSELCTVMRNHFAIGSIHEIVSGGANGADFLAAKYANESGIKLTEFLPEWEKYGKRAGFLRNEDIIKNCDMVLAFWDGQSRGTGNSLSIAKRLKKDTVVIYY